MLLPLRWMFYQDTVVPPVEGGGGFEYPAHAPLPRKDEIAKVQALLDRIRDEAAAKVRAKQTKDEHKIQARQQRALKLIADRLEAHIGAESVKAYNARVAERLAKQLKDDEEALVLILAMSI